MVRRGRRKGGKYKEGDMAVVVIPTDSREIVQRLQEIVDFPEQVVYRTLVHCRRNPHEAVVRLLAQAEASKGKEEERKRRRQILALKKWIMSLRKVNVVMQVNVMEASLTQMCDYIPRKMSKLSTGFGPESSNAQGIVMAGSSTTAGILGPYKSDLTNGETNIVPISSVKAVPLISEPSSSDLTNGETEMVPTSLTEALSSVYVPSSSDLTNGKAEIVTMSSVEAVQSESAPSSSDLINGEATLVPISSAEAVSSISAPSSRDLTNVGTKKVPKSSSKTSIPRPSRLVSATLEQRTMADVVKMSLGLSKESVTKATLKDDPSSNSLLESAATRDQLQEPASVSNQDLCDDDVTSPFSNSFIDSAAKSDQLQESASISNEILRDQLQESASVFNQNLHDNSISYLFKPFIEYAARQDQLLESASVSNQKLCDDDVTNPFSYSFVEGASGRNQLCEYQHPESTSLSNQHLHNDYGGSRLLGGEDNNKNEVERHSFELNRINDLPASVATCLRQLSIETNEPEASVKDNKPTHQQFNNTSDLPLLIFGTYGSGQSTNFLLQSSNDDSEEIDDPKTFVTDNQPYHQHVNTSGLQQLTFGTFALVLGFGVVVFCIGFGVFILHFVEEIGWFDLFYFSVMSVSTIGYGDGAFKTMTGRLLAAIWLLLSTLALFLVFLFLAEARVDHRNSERAKRVLGETMSVSQFIAADNDNVGSLSKVEFLIYQLKKMDKITDMDIIPIAKQFDKLDQTYIVEGLHFQISQKKTALQHVNMITHDNE